MSRRKAVVVAVLVGLLVVLGARIVASEGPARGNPFAERLQAVDPSSAAAKALGWAPESDRALLARLAAVPTAVWLVPETFDTQQVALRVAEVVRTAKAQDRVPVLVVYGIPDRDCTGGYSAGGLDADGYRAWVDSIASEAGGAAVVLEPDALASAVECDALEERVALLGDAAERLHRQGAWVYLDAGHSDWVEAGRMAQLVDMVGTDHLRGISTNVSSYQTPEAEHAFAEQVLARLPGDLHYVVDTGRSGAGPGAPGDFCNPPGRALGLEPDHGGGLLDAHLWIKPPGESDGTCNGGPAAGEFWLTGALDLARNAGWS